VPRDCGNYREHERYDPGSVTQLAGSNTLSHQMAQAIVHNTKAATNSLVRATKSSRLKAYRVSDRTSDVGLRKQRQRGSAGPTTAC